MARGSVAFDMSSDPGEFTEATEAFSGRRIISREEADLLEGYARQRAFWISGVAQMDVVNDAHKSLLLAIKNGTSFRDWKKEIGPKLEKAWGSKDSARLSTIYQNATLQAYNAGRWEQMHQPKSLAMRPYGEFDGVRDSRQTEICLKCDGTRLPLTDPWWLTHSPMLHHNCRSAIRTQRTADAQKKGVTNAPPPDVPEGQWGLAPGLAEVPKPVDRKTPPDPVIHRELYLKKQGDEKRRKPVKIKLKKEHDPKHWEEHYREKYGDSAAQVGYGRAVHERAKDMGAQDALGVLDSLPNGGVGYGISPARRRDLIAEAAMKKPFPQMNQEAKLLASHAKLVGGNVTPKLNVAGSELELAREAVEGFYKAFSSSRISLPTSTRWRVRGKLEPKRAHWVPGEDRIELGFEYAKGSAVHEYGHTVEVLNGLGKKSRAFVEARTRGEKLQRLSDLVPESSYLPSEMVRPDKFYDVYIGKEYQPFRSASGELVECTEVLSTVVGEIADGKVYDLLQKDPETLYFVLGLLAGF